jgi:predicted esterase
MIRSRILSAFALASLAASALSLAGCGDEDAAADPNVSDGDAGTGGDSGGGASGGAGDSAGGSGGEPAEPTGADRFIPEPSGACPEFTDGTVEFDVDGTTRKVEIAMSDAAKEMDGPVIFFWHGMGSSPADAQIFNPVLSDIKAQGGLLVSPYSGTSPAPPMGFPWYLTSGGGDLFDMDLADEIVACAKEKVGIDSSRIHTTGFSAGALNSVQFAMRRSGYVASMASWSGGLMGAPDVQDPENKYAAFLFHGGSSDVQMINFETVTTAYKDNLDAAGHFSMVCNHGGGHSYPQGTAANVWQFFQDHPYGTAPSPYDGKIPAAFPSYCE